MNLRKSMLSCLSAAVLLVNISNVGATGEATSDSDLKSLISTAINSGKVLQLSYSVSYRGRRCLNEFLFGNTPWSSLPEETKRNLKYVIKFGSEDSEDFNISIRETNPQDIPYSSSLPILYVGNDAKELANKIIDQLEMSQF